MDERGARWMRGLSISLGILGSVPAGMETARAAPARRDAATAAGDRPVERRAAPRGRARRPAHRAADRRGSDEPGADRRASSRRGAARPGRARPGRARPGRARPARARARPGRRATVVLMAARDQAAAAKDLRRAVAAQLSDAPVRLKVHWLPKLGADLRAELGAARRLARSQSTRVVFWCDLTGSDDVYLYLSDRDGGRLLVRQVPQTAGGARADSVAIIVGSSVRAFLRSTARAGPATPGPRPDAAPRRRTAARRGAAARPTDASAGRGGARRRPGSRRAVAMARTRPTSRRAVPGAEARGGKGAGGPGDPAAAAGAAAAGEGRVPTLRQPGGPRPTRLSLDLSYALDTYNGDNAPVHGASIGLSYRFHPMWSAFLAYRVVQPINGVLPDIAEATLQRHPISAGGRIHHRMGRFEVGGALALVVDYMSTEAREAADSGSNFVKDGPGGYWQVLAGAELRGAYSPVRRLWICFAVGAELIIYSSQFAVNVPSEPEPVPIGELAPWFFQPYARLGLRVDLY